MASSHRYGHSSEERSAPRSSATSPSSPSHSRDTRDRPIDSRPRSEATASTFLVEMPAAHMSHTAEARAVSVRDQRATTSSGKYVPSLSLGILSATRPTQVSSERSR